MQSAANRVALVALVLGTLVLVPRMAVPVAGQSGGPYTVFLPQVPNVLPYVIGPSHVVALTIDPTHTTTVYAGTGGGGLFKTTDGGAHWNAINTGLTTSWVSEVAVDPFPPATVYAGTDAGVFKSTNGGGNWIPASTGLPSGQGSVCALAVHPTVPLTIYAGLPGYPPTHALGGLFRSTDGGATWRQVSTGGNDQLEGVCAVVFDPKAPTTIFAGAASGVFKSTNGGITWSNTSPQVIGIVSDIEIDPSNPNIVYAGASSGLYKSTNGGTDWTPLNSGLTAIYGSWVRVYALVIDPNTPATLYLAASSGYDCTMSKSTDAGATWAALRNGMPGDGGCFLAIDPTAPSTLYAGTQRHGVYKTTDGGASWFSVNTGLLPDIR